MLLDYNSLLLAVGFSAACLSLTLSEPGWPPVPTNSF